MRRNPFSNSTRAWTFIFILLFTLCPRSVPADSLEYRSGGTVRVQVWCDKPDWQYEVGDQVKFHISVTRNWQPLKDAEVKVTIGPEMMPPTIEKTLTVTDDVLTTDGGTMKEPGFLRCQTVVRHNGINYRNFATAGFSPEEIRPTTKEPPDFSDFWKANLEELAAIPLDTHMTLNAERSNKTVNVYDVDFQNIGLGLGSSRIYGVLCVPNSPGKYPAILELPGAGHRSYEGLIQPAEKGIITLQIGVHGIPINLDRSLYRAIGGALPPYQMINMDDRQRYYGRRFYLGCVRANDFLTSLPEWDGHNLAVTGFSQGGGLSIVTAALDPRVSALAVYTPGMCDWAGDLNGRAGGAPQPFRYEGNRTQDRIETSRYYDVVNFAKRVKAPGIYTWGFNDWNCPPTSMFAAYNVIPGPKSLLLALELQHSRTRDQRASVNAWLDEQFDANKK
jgi:cephalosporin-C deacetylase